eukprot:5060909-Prymnesium_polylepis.1
MLRQAMHMQTPACLTRQHHAFGLLARAQAPVCRGLALAWAHGPRCSQLGGESRCRNRILSRDVAIVSYRLRLMCATHARCIRHHSPSHHKHPRETEKAEA